MKIAILTDKSDSWYIRYGAELAKELGKHHHVTYVHDKAEVPRGDICFLLSCVRRIEEEYLRRNENNIVVHASDLPHGRGFSPLQWQILEGRNEICVTLLEAVAEVDAGPYYCKDVVRFEGHELLHEMRHTLAKKVNEMCVRFVRQRSSLTPQEQSGMCTYYEKRTRKDDALDIDKSLREQFVHLRIADNECWPVYFDHLGHRYLIKITKERLLD